jgi:hypothetical protein
MVGGTVDKAETRQSLVPFSYTQLGRALGRISGAVQEHHEQVVWELK